MPYIVILNMPGCLPEQDPRAVATIEEARENVHEMIGQTFNDLPLDAEWSELHYRTDDLPDTGGVIGPLPDGYVIDVQCVGWIDFEKLVRGMSGERLSARSIVGELPDIETFDSGVYRAALIDAYNG